MVVRVEDLADEMLRQADHEAEVREAWSFAGETDDLFREVYVGGGALPARTRMIPPDYLGDRDLDGGLI